MKLLIKSFPPVSYDFISLASKYFLEQPVLKHLQSMFSFNERRQVSYPYKITGKNITVCFNFYVFRKQMKIQQTLNWTVEIISRISSLYLEQNFPFVAVLPKYLNFATFSKDL
jgi:hypothetical protein